MVERFQIPRRTIPGYPIRATGAMEGEILCETALLHQNSVNDGLPARSPFCGWWAGREPQAGIRLMAHPERSRALFRGSFAPCLIHRVDGIFRLGGGRARDGFQDVQGSLPEQGKKSDTRERLLAAMADGGIL